MRVLGIEGTAWAGSAAVYDTETDVDAIHIESDPYEPDTGGIHPREAAEHMSEAIPQAIERVLQTATDTYGPDPIDIVAFSRGPGLGPCLRIAGTAARALAGSLEVPLVGVNHMIAHLEIGRDTSGFSQPICLNASGANAHLLGYRDGRYRVLGETMDTGVGNAIDKFTRHLGWSHPGGPKVESAAADGEFIELPYVVKGMDFSFAGITSAAIEAYDSGATVEDVCFSLQEHLFAMLTEVAERALSLTGANELLLGGGVGQNDRLREMLTSMCEERGAVFHAPAPQFLRDNAGMIAVLGAKMAAADDTISIAESSIDSKFRPDQVPVSWRADESTPMPDPQSKRESPGFGSDSSAAVRGAEATVEFTEDRVIKRRIPKPYRDPTLDERLRQDRTVLEARLTAAARRAGVPTPLIHDIDTATATLVVQRVGSVDLAEALTPPRARFVGRALARLHDAGFVHGDPTTRNVRVGSGRDFPPDSAPNSKSSDTRASHAGNSDGSSTDAVTCDDGIQAYLIDFGLGYHTSHVEDHAMDLHVFKGSVGGTVSDPVPILDAFEAGYQREGAGSVLDRLGEIEDRGRYL